MATGVGMRIMLRRKALKLSQEALASRLGLKSKSTICKVERGDDNLTTDTIAKYAEALNTTPGYLVGWVSDPSPNYDPKQLDNATDEEQNNDQEISKAIDLYAKYQSAPPEIQTAIETLLKASSQSES